MSSTGLAKSSSAVVFFVAAGVTDARTFWEAFVTAAWLASVFQVLVAEWWISTTRRTDLDVKAV